MTETAGSAPARHPFMDESWVEHLRRHERASVADREILNRAKQFLGEGETTHSSHWLGGRESDREHRKYRWHEPYAIVITAKRRGRNLPLNDERSAGIAH
jgi:Transmembrane secretion effector